MLERENTKETSVATESGGRGSVGNKDREAVVAADRTGHKQLGYCKDFTLYSEGN